MTTISSIPRLATWRRLAMTLALGALAVACAARSVASGWAALMGRVNPPIGFVSEMDQALAKVTWQVPPRATVTVNMPADGFDPWVKAVMMYCLAPRQLASYTRADWAITVRVPTVPPEIAASYEPVQQTSDGITLYRRVQR